MGMLPAERLTPQNYPLVVPVACLAHSAATKPSAPVHAVWLSPLAFCPAGRTSPATKRASWARRLSAPPVGLPVAHQLKSPGCVALHGGIVAAAAMGWHVCTMHGGPGVKPSVCSAPPPCLSTVSPILLLGVVDATLCRLPAVPAGCQRLLSGAMLPRSHVSATVALQ